MEWNLERLGNVELRLSGLDLHNKAVPDTVEIVNRTVAI